ncbi:amidohydrolase [Sporosarcina globispora]|uniref:Amidohydrolase n=1 Tax=Sporosarcina globispora TaxID=1459 RepID=A0A0M0GE83_SPOGL|nr:M20 peptidase aminoacylase family protein [Sporosarcina globispora]KON88063.1 amidohydrolase [Sporosarcina globispora]
MIDKIREWISRNQGRIEGTYQYLHENAEISWEEVQTTKFLCKQLERIGIPYETFEEHTGLVGYWGSGKDGPTIGIRADMDALWQRVNGEWKANHSCGHDAHMTMVLYSIICLKELGFSPKGLVKIIFQPAEESGYGAKAILERGIIEDIDYLLGTHVRPIQELPFGVASPAIYHGATTLLKGRVTGVQAHGARPNLGVNVVDSLAGIVQAVNSVQLDPTKPASAKVTVVKAGGDNINVIPDYAEFGIDLRAQENDVMKKLIQRVEYAVITAGSANQATVEVEELASMVAAEPCPEMEEIIRESIAEALGDEGVAQPPVTPGGEDFHFYKASFTALKSTMVGLGTGLQPGLHHPEMSFNIKALHNGIAILSLAAVKLLKQEVNEHVR